MEKRKNYCTACPDTVFGKYIGGCCEHHDDLYRKGGTAADRKAADMELRRCVTADGGLAIEAFGWGMYLGTRIGGSYVFSRFIRKKPLDVLKFWVPGKQRFNWATT